jgi:hypothetical protein
MRQLGYFLLMVAGLLSLLVLPLRTAFAESKEGGLGQDQARVTEIVGEAFYQKVGTKEWKVLVKDFVLVEGDAVRTGKDSQLKLAMGGDQKIAEVLLKKESQFSFKDFRHDAKTKSDTTLLNLEMGSVLVNAAKMPKESKFQVKTPTSIVGIRGTKFEVNVERASSSKTS